MGYRIGIDAGTTVTKLATIKDGKVIDLLRVDSVPSDDDIKALYDATVKHNRIGVWDIEHISITGVGATGFSSQFTGIIPDYVHEFDANVAGANFLAGDTKEFLLISLGTGTSYIHVKDKKGTHAGGLGMGGGTLRGLSKYILGTTDVHAMDKLAMAGRIENVNLTMADITKEQVEGLADELTASNFGKIEVAASKEDLAAGIYSLVLENAIQTGCMLAGQLKIKTIVMIGGLCNSSELPNRLKLFKEIYPDMDFVVSENGSYNTAIGAALLP